MASYNPGKLFETPLRLLPFSHFAMLKRLQNMVFSASKADFFHSEWGEG